VVYEYFLKQNKIVKDDKKDIEFKQGYYTGLIITKRRIKIFHHTGWWIFPLKWFDLTKIKDL
jgi:hypothetical protein